MSEIKGGCGGGGGRGKDPCVQVDPCQTTAIPPTPVQCIGTVDPCQANQSGSIAVGCSCGCGSATNCGRGGQINQGIVGTKK